MNEKIKRALNDKKIIIAFLAIIGAILIIISSAVETGKDKATGSFDNSYGEYLEKKLETTLSGIHGVGKTDVMITFENSYETFSDTSNQGLFSSGKPSDTVIEKPLPKIAGVMIVCSGIASSEDFKTIKKATSTVLGIHENKINIIGGKSS